MDQRSELQTELETILGSKNVYYQPPESVKLKYPCIVYYRSRMALNKADNQMYLGRAQYALTLIGKSPDNPIIYDLLKLPFATYDRTYVSDNLHHDVFTIYY